MRREPGFARNSGWIGWQSPPPDDVVWSRIRYRACCHSLPHPPAGDAGSLVARVGCGDARVDTPRAGRLRVGKHLGGTYVAVRRCGGRRPTACRVFAYSRPVPSEDVTHLIEAAIHGHQVLRVQYRAVDGTEKSLVLYPLAIRFSRSGHRVLRYGKEDAGHPEELLGDGILDVVATGEVSTPHPWVEPLGWVSRAECGSRTRRYGD